MTCRAPVGEDELIAQARSGSAAAFEALITRHADRVRAGLLRSGVDRAEAQEVMQETFLRAWRSLDRYESRSSFFTWIYRIALNEANRRLARRAPRATSLSGELGLRVDIADRRPGPAAEAETGDLRTALEAALAQLPSELRLAVFLRDFEGLSVRDAAGMLAISEGAFKSRLHRGRTALRELLRPWRQV